MEKEYGVHAALVAGGEASPALRLDPRDPDPTRDGIFRNHNCWRCNHGAKPCPFGHPNQCEYPHARND